MPVPVSDRGSNKNELIEHAAEVLGSSKHRQRVFEAIYKGKAQVKTVPSLITATGLPHRRVLDAGKRLATQDLVEQVKIDTTTAYRKIDFFQTHRDRILRLAKDPKARSELPTKRRPAGASVVGERLRLDVRLRVPKSARARLVTVDDIPQFKLVRKVPKDRGATILSETQFKQGLANILGERGRFTDWGGESRDLSSTRLMLEGRRRAVAFALKGPGTKGRLTPGKMGKNGDQIQRLLRCPAEVFFVQYWAEIDDSVLEQLESLAKLKAYLNSAPIWYGIIDGCDSTRLIEAYPSKFYPPKGKA